ncbi:MAG: HEAT repeat domain-containing protein [Candidatus Eisenbacteria bacterium]|nr:HEAT repeat domain-containing protein [Candidatus Eisenbacteria bacterium]
MDPIDLYRTFRRALRACQLYPQGSRVRQDASERLAERFRAALEERGEGISFAFLEDGTYVNGQPVPVGEGDDTAGLGEQLFRLGIREFRFLPGLEATEVLRLLGVLTRARLGELNPVDEDLSILLWESDLGHVGYLLYEEHEEFEEEVTQEQIEVEEMISKEPPIGDYLEDDEVEMPDYPVGAPTGLTEAERLRVLADFQRETEEDIPHKYGRVLVEILRVETDQKEVPRLERHLHEYLEALMASERFAILQRLSNSLELEGDEIDPVRHAFGRARDWFLQSELYTRAARLAQGHPTDQEAADAFLVRVPEEVVPDLASLLLDERAEVAPQVFDRIRARIRESADVLGLCLADPRTEVRKLALEEAGVFDRTATRRVRELLTSPDPELRLRAAGALARSEGPDALEGLAEALEDPEVSVRIAAAEALAHRGANRCLELLLRIIVGKDFVRKGLDEKKVFFHAAGRIAPEEVLPVLARLAEQRRFWPSRDRAERSEAALDAMSRLGADARTFVEDRWRRRRPDLMKRFDQFYRHHAGRMADSGNQPANRGLDSALQTASSDAGALQPAGVASPRPVPVAGMPQPAPMTERTEPSLGAPESTHSNTPQADTSGSPDSGETIAEVDTSLDDVFAPLGASQPEAQNDDHDTEHGSSESQREVA